MFLRATYMLLHDKSLSRLLTLYLCPAILFFVTMFSRCFNNYGFDAADLIQSLLSI